MYQFLDDSRKKQFFNIIIAIGILLSLFLAVKAINAVKEYSNIGKGIYPSNTISVSGTAEVFAIPDTASLSFSVVEEGKDVAEARDKSAKKINSIIDSIKSMGVEDKDIKTTGYNAYPRYDYTRVLCNEFSCPPSKQVLIGYEVSQTITLKIRKTDKAGEILTKVGDLGASNISGLDFVVDDMDAIKAEAREKAIANAKDKAKALSKSLNVKLVDIVSFYEMEPSDIYGRGMGGQAYDEKLMSASPVVPQLPVGENKYVSNVSITYEIR
ncbi:MAG: SIMPL domain-containing protein [Candidatus Paceibacterota bacterium]